MPMVSRPTVWWRKEGKRQHGDADRDRQHHRVHGLRDEEVRHSLEVVDDAGLRPPRSAASQIGCRVARAGRRRARRAAAAHRDADVRVLQGEDVVDTVAGLATTWPRSCIALTIARFCCGVTRPEHRRRFEHHSQASWVLGQRPRVDRAPPPRARRRAAPTVAGWSPEITLIVTPCAAKYANVSAASERIAASRRTSARV